MRKFAEIMVKLRVILCVFALILTGICGAMISNVNINTDMTKYLADSSQMKEGLKVMSDEITVAEEANVIRVLFKGLSDDRKDKIVKELGEIKNVLAVNYDSESREYNKDDYTLFKVETEYDVDSKEEIAIRKAIENRYASDNVIVRNDAASSSSVSTGLIAGIGIAVLVILLVMSYSWIEPLLYALIIAIAVVMNMGTNALLGSVSQITNLLAIILQVVFTIDYSIMLMNRYRDERKLTDSKTEAMSGAFAKAFSSVTGSSIATCGAVIMLVFMSFKLGTDMGIVFAKSILCSGLSVITVLPAVIVGCDKVLEVTAKPVLPLPTKLMGIMSNKLRFIMPIALTGLFIASFYMQESTGISFTSSTDDEISKIIPNTNAVVALYNNEDANKIENVTKELEKDPNVVGTMSYPTSLGKENTAKEMSQMVKELTSGSDISIDESILSILYYDYYSKGELPTMTVSEFVNFLADDVATNETFASQIDASMVEQLDTLKQYTDAEKLTSKMNAEQLAKFLGMKEDDIKSLFVLYYSQYGGVNTGSMTLPTFVNFLANDVMTDKTYSSMFDESTKQKVELLKTYTNVDKMTAKSSYVDIAKILGMDSETVKLLYVYYYSKAVGYTPDSMDLPTFVEFLTKKVMTNKAFASYFDKDTAAQFGTVATFTNKDLVQKKLYSEKMAPILGVDKSMIDLIYVFYYGSQKAGQTALTLPEFTNFLINKVLPNPMLSGSFDEATKATLKQMNDIINISVSGQKLGAKQLAAIFGMKEADIAQLLYAQATIGAITSGGDVSAIDPVKITVTLPEFIEFVVNMKDYAGKLTPVLQQIEQQVPGFSQLVQLPTEQLPAVLGTQGIPEEQQQIIIQTIQQYTQLVTLQQTLLHVADSFTPELKATLGQMNQLIGIAKSGMKLGTEQISNIFGIEGAQAIQLYTLYAGIYTDGKQMTPIEIVNYLLEAKKAGGVVGAAIDDSLTAQLALVQNLMNLTVSGTKFTYDQLASMFSIDKATMKMLFTLHDSYGDISSWKLSMQTIVDFLLNNSAMFGSMMDAKTLADLKLAQSLINGSVSGTKYSAKELSDLLGMDKETLSQIYLLHISKYGDISKWQMSLHELMTYLVEDILTNKSLAPMLGDKGDTLKTAKILMDAVVSKKSYTSTELMKLVGSLAEGLEQNMIDLLYLYYGSVKHSDPSWKMSVSTLFDHLANSVVKDEKFNAFLDDDFKANITTMKTQLDDGIKQLVGENYSLMLITTLYPSESASTHQFVGKVDTLMSNECVLDHYLMGASVMTYELEQVFKQEMMVITLLAAIAIFIVVLMTFRSAIIPTVIVLMLHCSIFVAVTASGMGGSSMNFVAYVIAQCVLTGISLNYAIMFTKNYIDYRHECDVEQALEYAYKGSINAVLTTGLMTGVVTGIFAMGSTDPTLSPICSALAIGTFTTIILAVFFLPPVVAMCDKLIYNPKGHKEEDIIESYQH